ncbi:tetratricopeptide repeat protein [Oceanidesulfovibrio marinus]|uniref:N-acetylmuramoyl-L-alanine amidase n=2 Tax=Oceanidesulfovibrio marinus TaxID=370038 RepID=A0ABX6NBA7_9BACT|nr:tetratricopeptide repeat protein [Oceanidesulfovibrio marinus]
MPVRARELHRTMTPISRRSFLIAGMFGLAGVLAPGPGVLSSLAAGGQDPVALGIEGQNLLAAGEPQQAMAVLGRALSMVPDDPWLTSLLGRAYLAAGDHVKAGEALHAAASCAPEDEYGKLVRSWLDETQPREETAAQEAEGSAIPEESSEPKAADTDMTPLEREAQKEKAALSDTRTSAMRVVLDPGHGGFDPGAVGPNGLQEKDVVLDVARRTARAIEAEAPGTRVFLTRSDDYYLPLSARTALANRYAADIFISCHANASRTRSAHGVETYHCASRASSREAARVAAMENAALALDEAQKSADRKADWRPVCAVDVESILARWQSAHHWEEGARASVVMQDVLSRNLDMRDRGVHAANFFVLRNARMPAVLLETGFVSNPAEESRLSRPETRDQVAAAVAHGVAALARNGREGAA